MKEVLSILFGAGFTAAVGLAIGSLFLRGVRTKLHRVENGLFAFMAGSALFSLLVTLLASMQLARKGVFLWTGLTAIAASLWRWRVAPIPRRTLPAAPLNWLVTLNLIFGLYFLYYFATALAPEISPDGSGYHLGNVARIVRHHGFDWDYRSMYSYLSQGLEMLFVVAFSLGRHSAAASFHFIWLCVLPSLMVCYGRRFGVAKAAMFGALAVFVSPVIAKDGVSAYNDLAVVTLIYAVFYLLQVWDQDQDDKWLIIIGLFSGFAYAVKYTALLTLPFAVTWIWWRRRLQLATATRLLLPAGVMILPWVLRNWLWTGNPVAPFANRWFPNPYYHPGMELQYVESLKQYQGIKHWWQIPLELTLRGGLVGGMFSPVFLMLPLSLLSLRQKQGRRLLFAALVFAVPAWMNTGARFLIPASPFVAISLGLALEGIAAGLPVALAFTALISWPPVVSMYGDAWNWRIGGWPIRQALRTQPVEPYILKSLPDVALAASIKREVPPGQRIFSFSGRPESYIERDIVVSYESSLGNLVHDTLWAPQAHPPVWRMSLRFLPVEVRHVRVRNNSTNDNYWTVAEMRVFSQGREIPRQPDWRVSAHPNDWEAPLAFDNNYATRWSTWEAMGPRSQLQIDFPQPTRLDQVLLECDPGWEAKPVVEVQRPDGKWVGLTDTVETTKAEPPGGIRKAAAQEVKQLGFRYLLINDGDFIDQDLKKYPTYWGVTLLAEANGTYLYRID